MLEFIKKNNGGKGWMVGRTIWQRWCFNSLGKWNVYSRVLASHTVNLFIMKIKIDSYLPPCNKNLKISHKAPDFQLSTSPWLPSVICVLPEVTGVYSHWAQGWAQRRHSGDFGSWISADTHLCIGFIFLGGNTNLEGCGLKNGSEHWPGRQRA